MCGRYTLANVEELAARFKLAELESTELFPRYNIAPSTTVPIVLGTAQGNVLRPMRWGFQPEWLRNPRQPPPINARAETLLERPFFRSAVSRSRCLVPADGFYEWAPVPGSRQKQAVYFRLRDRQPFAFAGIYTGGRDVSDAAGTCAIVTTTANDLVAPVHSRMPVLLRREDEDLWLDPDVTDPTAAIACLRPYPAAEMEAYPVSRLVSSVRNEGPELIRPLLER